MKYMAYVNKEQFEIEKEKKKVKNTQYLNFGSRFIQILITLFLLYDAGKYAIGFNKRVGYYPIVYTHIQSYWTALFIIILAIVVIWVIERVRDHEAYITKVTRKGEDGHISTKKYTGLYGNPQIGSLYLNDLIKEIENEP